MAKYTFAYGNGTVDFDYPEEEVIKVLEPVSYTHLVFVVVNIAIQLNTYVSLKAQKDDLENRIEEEKQKK